MPSRFGERQRMTVLAFDCAISGLAVAVVRDGAALAERREAGRGQAATLLPAIARALEEAAVDRHALSLIAVTVGPGSFTGVRVGLAAARGLALALDIPLAGLTTTAALLAAAPQDGRLAVAAIDTHLGDWFCAIDGAPFVASTEALAARLAGKPCRIVGPQAETLAPLLPDAVAQQALPDPALMARVAMADGIDAWRVRNRTEGLPRPLYLRGVNVTAPDGTRRTVETG
ncbi:MAG: tRNA (adenosine(37)-N6)-threonylcarbamoyltransferase complex dimerization subunit type 1 TsaB [Reyranella sp.]|uniref:tRNA (adenosine(37)-N6)-threonylcarbamoyltransferase complex dimerization subunit type 1 TsaB n=1 Tax=Reyranella sp. TaxID=1929291 RepID=UPI001AD433B4|nr:tRNA (adenosine(37)-N6)-threonylcarbamoyltransferase complex dimerization subunit type 1 TsaB [Reyranella sp.]MBN9090104.1 tRNA (adenosine(37)-N6)-threonylcarbamoyltransferase complex dimerization subunit type 1 TsaB [Reyranella sp.]